MVVVTVGCNVRSGRWWAPALSTHATPICPYKAASPPFYLALWSATPPPPGVVYGVIKLLLYSSLDNLVGVRLLFTLHRQSSRHRVMHDCSMLQTLIVVLYQTLRPKHCFQTPIVTFSFSVSYFHRLLYPFRKIITQSLSCCFAIIISKVR